MAYPNARREQSDGHSQFQDRGMYGTLTGGLVFEQAHAALETVFNHLSPITRHAQVTEFDEHEQADGG